VAILLGIKRNGKAFHSRIRQHFDRSRASEYWKNLFNEESIIESNAKYGIGPFFAIQPGTGGIMIGLKTPKDGNNPVPIVDSLNIGLGISVEPNSKTLGDGLQPNEPVPSGATVRTQTRSLVGVTIMISAGF